MDSCYVVIVGCQDVAMLLGLENLTRVEVSKQIFYLKLFFLLFDIIC